ncbi:MAG: hypothetical protein AAF569_07410, partial [Pseudomonadota bacterium]
MSDSILKSNQDINLFSVFMAKKLGWTEPKRVQACCNFYVRNDENGRTFDRKVIMECFTASEDDINSFIEELLTRRLRELEAEAEA